jgi:probable HAF family extracellular repeat protein
MELKASILSTFTVCLALPFTAEIARSQPAYNVLNLGTAGGTEGIGFSILNSRLAWVGGYGSLADGAVHALEWRGEGSAIDLGTLGSPAIVLYSALYGTKSGYSEIAKDDPLEQNFCGDLHICLPFVLKAGAMVRLPTLGGYNGLALYDNGPKGQIVGLAQNAALDVTCSGTQQYFLPTIWQNGKAKQIPLLPGDVDGEALGINSVGQVVGTSGDCSESVNAWLWTGGNNVVNLGNLGYPIGNEAYSVNNYAQVTGVSVTGAVIPHAFLWQDGVMTDLGTLPGDYYSYGSSINNFGQIVGESCSITFFCRAFLWESGEMYDLNTLIPANSGLYLLAANVIDDFGNIAGSAYYPTTGTYPAFSAVLTGSNASMVVPAVQAEGRVSLPDVIGAPSGMRGKRTHYGPRRLQP